MKSTWNYNSGLRGFKGKNVIVTGATGSIGCLVVKKLLSNGANVVGLIHNQKNINNLLKDYMKTGQFDSKVIDFEKGREVTEKFKEVMITLGGRLDCLICCHGEFIPGNVTDIQIQDFDKNINVNVRANFHLLSLSVPFLKISKGNVVMISSIDAKIVEKGEFLHALSKSMINSMIENAALELASFGVRVNGVAPSFVNNKFRVGENLSESINDQYLEQMKDFCLLKKEIIEPEEVAEAILFLASDEASFMTGEIMTIDSGFELNHDLSFGKET